MKKAISLTALIFLCLLFPFTGLAQEEDNQNARGTGTISGKLQDSLTKEPLEFATIALIKKGVSQPVSGTVTNQSGNFTLQNVAEGTYSIAVNFLGYSTKEVTEISVTEGKNQVNIGTVELIPDASQLDAVTIQSQRPTIVQKADRLVVNIEGSSLAAGNTAYHVLANAPGVYIDQDGNIQLNGRSGVTVMLNDKLTYLSARDLRTLLEGMSAENIKTIEIITNPSAKYDAEGSSGILNINLKNNTLKGINGSVYAGYTYNFKQHGYSTGGRINYKANRWDSYLSLDMARRVGGREATFTRVFFTDTETTYFDQVATGNYLVQGPPSVRAGTDYRIDEKNSIGIMGYFTTNNMESDFLTDTYIGPAPQQPELYIDADNFNENRYTNYTANVHYTNKIDTLGTSLSADLDFVKITNRGEANFYNFYEDLTSDEPVRQDFLYTSTPNGFDIYSGKVDYTKIFESSTKFELGAKASRVVSDNDSRFYFNNTDELVLDPARTNHFLYDENILAAYVNFSDKLGEKFTLQAGLRAEHTSSTGESLTINEINERDYLSFFPSVFVQQNVSENYGINYSYSRRIQRPNYGNLNPFISYRDPYTYWQGNPELRPQFTHAFGITQTYKNTYSLALNYQLLKDVMSEIPILIEETATTIYTIGNVDDSQNLSLTAIAPLKITDFWDTNNTFVLSYNEFRTMQDDLNLENDQVFYMLQSGHNIQLPYKIRMEINGTYRSAAASGLYLIAPMWWVHAGLKKSFLDDKLELSVNVNDIFRSYRLKFTTDIGENINDFDQYFRGNTVGFTLRYNFSSGAAFEAKQRREGPEEVDRVN